MAPEGLRPELEHLLKLRLVIARFGEMDGARWWNTNGQLGKLGAAALRRGMPRTHYFAQARSVFAVAAHRCREVYDPPGAVTLWSLPQSVEQAFDARWEQWLDSADEWKPFFEELASANGGDLLSELEKVSVLRDGERDRLRAIRPTEEARSVALPGTFDGSDSDLTLLAAAFSLGKPGNLIVPYMAKSSA